MKKLVLILIFVLSFETNVLAQEVYKAQTPEECIKEKECAWIEFAKRVGLLKYDGVSVRKKTVLHKWERDVNYDWSGLSSDQASKLANYLSQLAAVFSHRLKKDDDPDLLFLVSKNLEKAYAHSLIHQKYPNPFSKKGVYTVMNKNGHPSCYNLRILAPDYNQKAVVSLVNSSSLSIDRCLKLSLYNSLGFEGRLGGLPFSAFSEDEPEVIDFTALDKFLVELLYQPEFKSGMGINEARDVFKKTYEDALESFLKSQKAE